MIVNDINKMSLDMVKNSKGSISIYGNVVSLFVF